MKGQNNYNIDAHWLEEFLIFIGEKITFPYIGLKRKSVQFRAKTFQKYK